MVRDTVQTIDIQFTTGCVIKYSIIPREGDRSEDETGQ